MKGLFLNDLYKSKHSMMILLGMISLIGIIVIGLSEQQFVVQAYMVCVTLSIPICSLTSSYNSDAINWNKYTIILPIKREKVIQEKYLFSISFFAVGILINVIILLLIINIRGFMFFDFGLKDIITLYCVSTALVFFIYSFCFFLRYIFNLTDSSSNIIISIIISVCLVGGIIYFFNKFNISLETGRSILVLGSLLLFLLSYKINQIFYCRKDID